MENGHITVYDLWFIFIVSINGLLLLQMENGHRTVYNLCFLFIVSIDGLLLLHFHKWRTGIEPCTTYGLFLLSPLMDCYFYTSTDR